MSTAGRALAMWLAGTTAVTDIAVGGIHRSHLPPEPTFPAVVIQLEDEDHLVNQKRVTGRRKIQPRIICLAKSGLVAEELAAEVKACLAAGPFTHEDVTLRIPHRLRSRDAEWDLDDRLNAQFVEPEMWVMGPAIGG